MRINKPISTGPLNWSMPTSLSARLRHLANDGLKPFSKRFQRASGPIRSGHAVLRYHFYGPARNAAPYLPPLA